MDGPFVRQRSACLPVRVCLLEGGSRVRAILTLRLLRSPSSLILSSRSSSDWKVVQQEKNGRERTHQEGQLVRGDAKRKEKRERERERRKRKTEPITTTLIGKDVQDCEDAVD